MQLLLMCEGAGGLGLGHGLRNIAGHRPKPCTSTVIDAEGLDGLVAEFGSPAERKIAPAHVGAGSRRPQHRERPPIAGERSRRIAPQGGGGRDRGASAC